MSSEILVNKEYFRNEEEVDENLSTYEDNEVNATNSSSNLNSNYSDDSSDTDSSLNENNEEEVEIRNDKQHESIVNATIPQQQQQPTPNPSTMSYQQNCLAAAQMMQLMSASISCQQASAETASPSDLNPTTAESEKENIPICKYCHKIFANFSNLNHHISAIHLNQSKWICSQCGKICSSKSNLKVHLRVHLRVKPYHCRWCSYSCMHHSSIRDHLAKVHPDKSHTPLQPGYLFNSHAVPEPEVFNSKGFNVNSFVSDSKMMKRGSETLAPNETDKTPEKQRATKKIKTEPTTTTTTTQISRPTARSRSPSLQNANHYSQQQQAAKFPPITPQQPSQSSPASSSSMSNLYNAYTMARMFHPFMYHPIQLQQYANLQQQQQQQQTSPNTFLNMLQYNSQRGTIQPPTYNTFIDSNNVYPSAFTSLPGQLSSSSAASTTSSSSEEHPTNSSNLSYSTSSRSSSMSPTNKISPMSKHASISTTTDDKLDKNDSFIYSTSNSTGTNANIKSVRKTLTVDQMLNNKVSKETQTESSCLSCPYCSNACL